MGAWPEDNKTGFRGWGPLGQRGCWTCAPTNLKPAQWATRSRFASHWRVWMQCGRRLFLCVWCVLVCGCSRFETNGDDPRCLALLACGQPQATCDLFSQAVLDEACTEAVLEAPCEEHSVPNPSYMELCFPPCGADTQTRCLVPDILRTCEQLSDGTVREVLVRCHQACALAGLQFSGVCSTDFQRDLLSGPVRSSQPQCWCVDE